MRTAKPYKGIPMEGMLATWYARNTGRMSEEFRACARRIAAHLSPGAAVLEAAPGPGYLAVELAKLGPYRITGIDISESFVRLASEHAAREGVDVTFRQGDAAALPFASETFDFAVCRAAFKNFSDPVGAIREMHRVLRPGGSALIIDLRNDVPDETIDAAVDGMHLDRINAFLTRVTFKHMLRKRAYSRADFQGMAAATPFGHAEIIDDGIGFDVWLRKLHALTVSA
ncbi:class I SAM-dependent methyltransferase [Rhodoplanes sp. Z2-YC6860]|uniref:class I SAM-dependent methyltransferase n=1 Tax=Rhodoplanes sp. Z2-YC6860 TaxID=674703 RepID=UPI00078B714E|nr:class I SAM-dependent methyltransferase [Rhodoplanes sp. Z2-YC6860]AMN40215.1 ubiquinone/menaquinone biosynthesis methyltransferase UbiE [Rhodoplanes sp. Z2-YC6860]